MHKHVNIFTVKPLTDKQAFSIAQIQLNQQSSFPNTEDIISYLKNEGHIIIDFPHIASVEDEMKIENINFGTIESMVISVLNELEDLFNSQDDKEFEEEFNKLKKEVNEIFENEKKEENKSETTVID